MSNNNYQQTIISARNQYYQDLDNNRKYYADRIKHVEQRCREMNPDQDACFYHHIGVPHPDCDDGEC